MSLIALSSIKPTMSINRRFLLAASALALLSACSRPEPRIDGRWDAILTVNKAPSPSVSTSLPQAETPPGLSSMAIATSAPRAGVIGTESSRCISTHTIPISTPPRSTAHSPAHTRATTATGPRVSFHRQALHRAPIHQLRTGAAGRFVASDQRRREADLDPPVTRRDHDLSGAILRLDGDTGSLNASSMKCLHAQPFLRSAANLD